MKIYGLGTPSPTSAKATPLRIRLRFSTLAVSQPYKNQSSEQARRSPLPCVINPQEYIMTFCAITRECISARDITDIYIARAYLRMRMRDAVLCYRTEPFKNPIELAKYLATYW